jgi:hypothetical protein
MLSLTQKADLSIAEHKRYSGSIQVSAALLGWPRTDYLLLEQYHVAVLVGPEGHHQHHRRKKAKKASRAERLNDGDSSTESGENMIPCPHPQCSKHYRQIQVRCFATRLFFSTLL